ncbi:MAG: protoheme IX farnesyltransferase [Candidatus Kapaibacterium sp.]|nr:MAG: protoheme IX farnesyltransferase [Candidatus Kapabacteria bacterium]
MVTSAVPVPASQAEIPTTASQRLRAILELSKPGITLMEIVTAAVGFVVAEPWQHTGVGMVLIRFAALSAGVLFLGASAGAFNHLLERSTDARMQRTSLRPLPAGKLGAGTALLYAVGMLVAGTAILWMVGWRVALLGVATVALYALAYTPLKTRTVAALFIGGIPGALPVVGGWVAGGGSIASAEAVILGGIMFWWQLPHFLALAVMYAEDYQRGKIALIGGGNRSVLSWHTLVYSVFLVATSLAWVVWGKGGYLYAVGCGTLSVWLLVQCVRLVRQPSVAQGRRVLLATYMFLMGLFLLAAVDIR